MKKVLRKILALAMVAALVAAFAVAFAACNDDGNGITLDDIYYDAAQAEEKGDGSGTLQLYVPDGAPVLAVAQFIAEKDTLTIAGYSVNVNIVPANTIGGYIAQGSGDIVIMPANAGANLLLQGAEYKFLCSNTQGILYMISTTAETVSPADLAGKRIGSIGQGAVPQYALEKILSENGLTDSVQVTYYADGAAVQAALTAGQIDFGVVGEPAATAGASKGFGVVMDIQAEFNAATDSTTGFPMSSTFIKDEFASNKTFVDAFLAALSANLTYIEENAAGMTALLQGAGSTSAYPPASIPRCNVGVYMSDSVKAAVADMLATLNA